MSCFKDIYFWRQGLILLSDCLHCIGTGFMLSFPAVLNPAILNSNSTDIIVTPNEASWIAASQGFAGPIGFILIPSLMQLLGRKVAHVILNISSGVGSLIFVLAENVTALYIARIIQGLAICGVYITSIILAEYSDPKRRGYFITLKKCFVAIGSLICHATDLCWTWRQIAFFAVVPNVLSLLLTLLWPESPAFLALKGRYEECDRSFTWLNGNTIKNRKQLQELISAQKAQRVENKKQKGKLKTIMNKLMKRDFIISFVIVSLLTMIVDASGRYYMLAYIVQMLTEITGDKSVAVYCTIGSDALTIIALLISSFVIRCFKRRTILFTSSTVSICLMFLTSWLAYLKFHYKIGAEVHWLIPAVILCNVFIVNAGVVPTCFAIIGEILPLEHKGMGSLSSGLVFSFLYALVMKFTPLMMEKIGIQGTFAIYALCIIICLLVLFFVLIETKDKTLQEIENEISGIKNPKSLFMDDVLLPS